MQNAVANSVNVTTSKAIIARREDFVKASRVVDVADDLDVVRTTFSSSFVRRRRSCIAWMQIRGVSTSSFAMA